jgi:hypothetical protein
MPDAFRNLRGCRLGELLRMLAIPPDPKTLAKVLTAQLDAVCLSTTLL